LIIEIAPKYVLDDILEAIGDLVASGCSIVCITCNTVHKWFDIYEKRFPETRFISVINATVEKILKLGLKRIFCVGSKVKLQTDL
jgi:aspartate/glutamate racemase